MLLTALGESKIYPDQRSPARTLKRPKHSPIAGPRLAVVKGTVHVVSQHVAKAFKDGETCCSCKCMKDHKAADVQCGRTSLQASGLVTPTDAAEKLIHFRQAASAQGGMSHTFTSQSRTRTACRLELSFSITCLPKTWLPGRRSKLIRAVGARGQLARQAIPVLVCPSWGAFAVVLCVSNCLRTEEEFEKQTARVMAHKASPVVFLLHTGKAAISAMCH